MVVSPHYNEQLSLWYCHGCSFILKSMSNDSPLELIKQNTGKKKFTKIEMQVKQVGALFAQHYGSFVFSFVEDENS